MTTRCPDLVDLVGAQERPEAHPLRQHLLGCGRCRAALRALEAFELAEGPAQVSAADLDDADRRLEAFLDARVARPRAPDALLPRRRGPAPWWTRGVLAAAAVLVAAVGFWLVGPPSGERNDQVGDDLRGDVVRESGGLSAVTVTADGAGDLVVDWGVVAGAEDYEIVLWDTALAEIARLAAQPGTNRRIAGDAAARPKPAFLSVIARQGGREIARSELVRLP